MRTNKSASTPFFSWTLLVLWVAWLMLAAIPERADAGGQGAVVSTQETVTDSCERLEITPVLLTQDWRNTVSVRPEPSTSQTKQQDLKKFHAALAAPTPALAASSLRLPQRVLASPVPELWYGFSFSSRSPPLAA